MVICKFYQQGYCRYGDRCHYEHIDYYQPKQATIGFSFSKAIQNLNQNQNQPKSLFNSQQQQQQPQPQPQPQQQLSKFSFNKALQQINNNENIGISSSSATFFNNKNDYEMKTDLLSPSPSLSSTINIFANSTFTFGNNPISSSSINIIDNNKEIYSNNQFNQLLNNDKQQTNEEEQTIKMKIKYGVYSDINNLNKNDIDNFMANDFTFPLPIDVPSIEFCF